MRTIALTEADLRYLMEWASIEFAGAPGVPRVRIVLTAAASNLLVERLKDRR